MNSPSQKKSELNLEEDILITPADFAALRQPPPHDPQDINSYLEFLEEIGAFATRKIKTTFYKDIFKL
jgi:hypothetical protein